MTFEAFWALVEEYGRAAYDDMDEPGVAERTKEAIKSTFAELSMVRLPTRDEAYTRASNFVVNELPKVIPAAEIGFERSIALTHALADVFEGGPFITPSPNEGVEEIRKKLGEVRIEELLSPDSETGRIYMLVSYGKNAREEGTLPKEVIDRLRRFSLGKPGRPPLTHVAVRDTEGLVWSLPRPYRHHHVLNVMYSHGVKQMEGGGNHENQGFLDKTGRYLTRRQAMVNAELNDQIKNGQLINASVLTSEDLW